MKKLLIAISILIVLAAAGGFYWYSTQTPEIVSEPIDAIPESASIIVSYPNITKMWDSFEEKDYYEALMGIEELERYHSRNLLFDSIIRYNQELIPLLEGAQIWSSFHSRDADSVQVLFSIQPNQTDISILSKLNLALSNSGIVSATKLGGVSGFKLVISEPFDILFVTATNGLILVANSKELLEESIARLNSGKSLASDRTFQKAVNSSGKNVEANIYINYNSLPYYLQQILKSTLPTAKGLSLDFASWTELDVLLKDDGLTCNGFTFTTDSLNQFLSLFLDQTPRAIEFPEYLPANTSTFVFYGISDLISFVADYRTLLSERGQISSIESKIDSLGKYYEIDLEQNLLGWIGKSAGMFITEPKSITFAEQSYWLIEANSGELATKLLSDLGIAISAKTGKEQFQSEFNGITIKQLPLEGIFTELAGPGYEPFANPFYIVYNNYVVLGTTEKSLQEYLQYIQADRSLAKELSFARFVENLGSSYNVFTYQQLSKSTNIYKSYLNQKAINAIDANKNVINDFEALGTQLTSTGQSFYSNVFLKHNPSWQDAEETSWKAQLGAELKGVPTFVKNHISGETEIIAQDSDNSLYLFNSVGQELFKRELPEGIQSKIVQVDAFKNDKLQYVFNTKNYIFLIDRNGNDVEGFPIELESPAETDLAVIEYDNKREYRLLITCKNKRIYNFEIDGKRVSGWRHNKASDPTIHSFKHLVMNRKDYLVTGESNGKIHLLDRRGKNRVRVKKRVVSSEKNELEVFNSKKSNLTGVYLTNEDGLIHRVALDGDVSSIEVGKFSKNHSFLVSDLNGDNLPEFLIFDLNVLKAFNHNKKLLFEIRIEPEAEGPFLIEVSETKSAIGFYYKTSEQLIAFDENGAVLSGFPLSGNSPFDLTQSKQGYICVSGGPQSNLLIQSLE